MPIATWYESLTAEVLRTFQHLIDIVDATPGGGQLALGDIADHLKAAGLEGEDLLEVLLFDFFKKLKLRE